MYKHNNPKNGQGKNNTDPDQESSIYVYLTVDHVNVSSYY